MLGPLVTTFDGVGAQRDNILFDRNGKLLLIDMEDCVKFHPNAYYDVCGNGRCALLDDKRLTTNQLANDQLTS